MSDSDLPNGTAADEPLSFDDGVVGIDALLDPQDADLKEDQATNEADAEDDAVEGDEPASEDIEDDADADPKDEGNDEDEDQDGPDVTPFAGEEALVKMADGRTITVKELRDHADTRIKEIQRHTTQKNQELSERSKQVEQAANALREHREFLLRVYEQNAPQPPDISMIDHDPIGYMQAKEEYLARAAEWQHMQQFSQAEQQRMQAETAKQQQEFLQQERTRMVERIPEFKDPAKLETFKADALKFGMETYEFTQDEVLAVNDSRYLAVLKDAIELRKLKAKAPAVKQAVQAKPQMMRGSKRVDPQTRNAREAKAKAERLRTTGTFDAGIAALMDLDL
jgi:hypothetical protein